MLAAVASGRAQATIFSASAGEMPLLSARVRTLLVKLPFVSDSCSEGFDLRDRARFSFGVMRFDQLIELLGPALYLDPVADAAIP